MLKMLMSLLLLLLSFSIFAPCKFLQVRENYFVHTLVFFGCGFPYYHVDHATTLGRES